MHRRTTISMTMSSRTSSSTMGWDSERRAGGSKATTWGPVLACDVLNGVLLEDDPRDGLWELVESGWASEHLPELPALELEQDPVHQHKDVLAHTIWVVMQSPTRLRVRLAALFHDIGKPLTRSYERNKVTFLNHEAVGATMTRRRMPKMGYSQEFTRRGRAVGAAVGPVQGLRHRLE